MPYRGIAEPCQANGPGPRRGRAARERLFHNDRGLAGWLAAGSSPPEALSSTTMAATSSAVAAPLMVISDASTLGLWDAELLFDSLIAECFHASSGDG